MKSRFLLFVLGLTVASMVVTFICYWNTNSYKRKILFKYLWKENSDRAASILHVDLLGFDDIDSVGSSNAIILYPDMTITRNGKKIGYVKNVYKTLYDGRYRCKIVIGDTAVTEWIDLFDRKR